MIGQVYQAINTFGQSDITYDIGLSIRGKVSELNVQIPCRVRLFEKLSGRLVADIATDEEGNYVFNHLVATNFFIIAHHPESKFNAIIQDNVVPK